MSCVTARTPASTDNLSLQQIHDNQAQQLDTVRHRPTRNELARIATVNRVAAIPGVGLLSATAAVATMGDPAVIRSGREFAAWLGLVTWTCSARSTRARRYSPCTRYSMASGSEHRELPLAGA